MSEKNIFDILLLIARPAAGKSEVIDYLRRVPPPERSRRFHVGKFEEIDDFPMLWTWFEEDQLLEQMGHPRLHTDRDGNFLHHYLWDLLIERIGLEYRKKLRDAPASPGPFTTIVEFSRGAEHGGYRSAFSHLLPQMLDKMAVVYIDVSWEESLRKNRLRFNPAKPDSILEHSLPDSRLELLYKEIDWEEVSRGDAHRLNIQGTPVPYIVFDNADDVTTRGGARLGERLEQVLQELWMLYTKPS
ncbi:MAG TPA: hypothetical protein VLZ89_07990 [Anaerolineales bacterium]|nr:hypothetical protein [Anaerolineales bacterium]